MRYLGVRVSGDMKGQVKHLSEVANRRLALLTRLFWYTSPATARSLYMGYVLSGILFAVGSWAPQVLNDISGSSSEHKECSNEWLELERIHLRGARIITGCC